jgi:hypothetical protein
MMVRILSVLAVLIALATTSVDARVVVNEVMANEPGSATSLEWLEIYNDSSQAVSLASYTIVAGTQVGPFGITIQPQEYVVFCRKLFSDQTSPGFEGIFGNNSGVWGDSPYEDFRQPIVASFSLRNDTGGVALYLGGIGGALVSALSWTDAGKDGTSWEREEATGSAIEQSLDIKGGSPGFLNSVTPVAIDLSLDSVLLSSSEGVTGFGFKVRNRGSLPVSDGRLTLYYFNAADPFDAAQTIKTLVVPPLAKDSFVVVEDELIFDSLYVHLGATLGNDYRWRNNRRDFVAPAGDYPPVQLSEILANPEGQLASEWIELKNRYLDAVDLTGWQIGDAVGLHEITGSSLNLDPDSFVVLVQDSASFTSYYTQFRGPARQPAGWPVLNNTADVVLLVDTFGIVADRFEYNRVYEDNFTWSRAEQMGAEGEWGRSEFAGGSPGEKNSVVLLPENATTRVSADPQVFSPDDNGFEDATTLSVVASEAEGYILKIYDRHGRVVKTFLDGEQYLRSEYEWDGRSDCGERLPIGIYIIYFEVSGLESVKSTVVIAR